MCWLSLCVLSVRSCSRCPRTSQQTPCACSRGACTPPSVAVAVGTVSCALTYLVLPRRRLTLIDNAIESLAGVTFPASLE